MRLLISLLLFLIVVPIGYADDDETETKFTGKADRYEYNTKFTGYADKYHSSYPYDSSLDYIRIEIDD